MVCAALNDNGLDAGADILGDAACEPWVQIAIGKDDVRVLPVLLGVVLLASEGSQGPVVVRGQIEPLLTLLRVFGVVPQVVLHDEN